jgi:DNA repair protein RecN (Recombination protein N)
LGRRGIALSPVSTMLTTLRIKNLALVEDLTLELAPGFNAITGETGAGKSIIIGALMLLLGERADRAWLRAGCDSCTVEAVFSVADLKAPIHQFLADNGLEPCEENQLVLKRTFTATGGNRQFINGSPASLSTLAALGEWLVDMHGPHDHQSLLRPAQQLEILDAFGKLEPRREAVAEMVRQRTQRAAEKAALIVDERTYAQRLDLLRHQVQEITSARLQPGEETGLDAEYQRASHAARLLELCQGALNLLAENEPSLFGQLGALGRTLQEIMRLDPAAANLGNIHAQAATLLRDLQHDLRHYADRLALDPGRLQQLEERLNLLNSLKRKYGATVAEVIAYGETAARELHSLEQRDVELERINGELAKLDTQLELAGKDLSRRRRQVIPQLGKSVVKQLAELGFKQSHFDAAIQTETKLAAYQGQIPATGFDTIEFQFAPNPGEPARSLRAIASSGEIARVMLALKTVLAVEDQIPVLIFDEVDANVGGETANVVGEKMSQIARRRQVLCITHLAPVAATAGAHYVVTKDIKSGRTITRIDRLENEPRIAELARMLGGGKAAWQHAQALLKR